GLSYRAALADLAILLSRIAIVQRVAQAIDEADPLVVDIKRLAGSLQPDAVQLFYTVAVHSRSELAIAPDEYAGFVMACLRMLSLSGAAGGSQQQVVPQAVQATTAPVSAPAASTASQKITRVAPAVPSSKQVTSPVTTQSSPKSVTKIESTASERDASFSEPEAEPEPELFSPDDLDYSPEPVFDQADDAQYAQALGKPVSDTIVLPEPWPGFSSKLPLSGMAAQLARQSECVQVSGRTILLRVATKALTEGAHADRLRAVLTEYFGFVVQVNFEIGAGQGQSAHAVDQAAQAARQQAAEKSVKVDPFVQALVKDFGAQVVPGSIRPGHASL
ncbi:MAG: DNA polymerase III subunit gamma/tau, partial [Alcaligenaceae bacterium]